MRWLNICFLCGLRKKINMSDSNTLMVTNLVLPHIISEIISLSKMNNRYGFIDWNKGLDPEFGKIVKWIIRSLRSWIVWRKWSLFLKWKLSIKLRGALIIRRVMYILLVCLVIYKNGKILRYDINNCRVSVRIHANFTLKNAKWQ